MIKIHRTSAPDGFSKLMKQWKEVEKDPAYQNMFPNLWENLSSEPSFYQALLEMTQFYCSYCNFSLPEDSLIHADWFHPLSEGGKHEWENLFPCCPTCKMIRKKKREEQSFNENILKPDTEDYDFEKYFKIKVDKDQGKNQGKDQEGKDKINLIPNPRASEKDQKRAQETLNYLGLNQRGLPQNRLQEFKRFRTQKHKGSSVPFSYPFLLNEAFEEEYKKWKGFKNFEVARVKKIKIKNIKCFHDIELVFDPSSPQSLLIGVNSRGKTTILQLITIALLQLEEIPFSFSWQQVVRKGAEKGEFEVCLLYREGEEQEEITLKYEITSNDKINFLQGEKRKEDVKKILEQLFVIGYGANRSWKLDSAKPYGASLEQVATLFGENAYLKNIQKSSTYKILNQMLKENFYIIRECVNEIFQKSNPEDPPQWISYDDGNLYFISKSELDASEDGVIVSSLFPLGALSEGYKATLLWLFDMLLSIVEQGGDIYDHKNFIGIVLIDEVDLHLHPFWQRTILPSLKEAFPKIQFLVSSHSLFVAQAIEPCNIAKLRLNPQNQQIEVDNEIRKIESEISYTAMGREIFEISSPFTSKTEELLHQFDHLKTRLLRKEELSLDEKKQFKELALTLAEKGRELSGVVQRGLIDIELETGKEVEL